MKAKRVPISLLILKNLCCRNSSDNLNKNQNTVKKTRSQIKAPANFFVLLSLTYFGRLDLHLLQKLRLSIGRPYEEII